MNPSCVTRSGNLERLFPGDSEMAKRMRAFDWSRSDIGPPETWPQNLRIALGICLTSRFPMHVWWGPSLTLFYNDAYISFLGRVKHPAALGRSGREACAEIWDTIGPIIERVFRDGAARWSEDMLMFVERELPREEVYVTFSFSPIFGEDDQVEGVYCACMETTEKIVGSRRLDTLRKLGVEAALARSVADACKATGEVLSENPYDLPFAAVYVLDEAEVAAHLAATSGLSEGAWQLPPSVSLAGGEEASLWPLASVFKTKRTAEVANLSDQDSELHAGPWPEPLQTAMVLPVHAAAHNNLAGLLVAGVSTRRPLDYAYRTFLEIVAGHIAAAIQVTNGMPRVKNKGQRATVEEIETTSGEQMRLAMMAAHILFWSIDVSTGESTVSANYADVVGFSEELRSSNVMEGIAKFVLPEDAARLTAEVEKTIRGEGDLHSEHRFIHPQTGEIGWIETHATLVSGADQASARVIGIARNITERKRLEDKLRRAYNELEERVRERTRELREANSSLQSEVRERRAAEERVKGLLNQLVTVQEEERRRIARELHDTLGQQLAALSLGIALFKAKADDPERLLAQIDRTQNIFKRLNADLDFLAWNLRPAVLDELGLNTALKNFVSEWSEHFGIKAEYHDLGLGAARLPTEVETNLYRILQEALQNVHKHAEADRVSVLLERRGDQVVLVVEDNGKGYDSDGEPAAGGYKGMGVTNMRERAALIGGNLEIESAPGQGATIYVRVPLNGNPKA